ncbi:MAG: MBL fold metallo-hydrolase [Candidatus Cloacimonetes bacterium]|nr:MBL fold metallo-hydrolase [Candidatus Cloacimonadota bacterium]
MIAYLAIWIIFNNLYESTPLQPGWGFSAWVEADSTVILFDTGSDGRILLANMQLLDLDPRRIDLVFLSHPHWDHSGGLQEVMRVTGKEMPVYIPASAEESFRKEFPGISFTGLEQSLEIRRGIYSTGELLTTYGNEQLPEQALVLSTPHGNIIITGCAHPGIDAIVEKTKQIFPIQEIYLVTGGFHLGSATRYQIDQKVESLKTAKVQYVAPSHCTGNLAIEIFQEQWGNKYLDLSLGKKFILRGK